jgi:hypothetical protein
MSKEETMESKTISLREGDIFRWYFLTPGDDRAYGRYHCCSQIAIVRGGRLRDTYWSSGNDGRSFGPDDLPNLELTRLGNLADLERAEEYKADYYDDADIVDLNHPNSTRGNFYLRKGAKRSAKKMLESALHKLEKAQAEERAASRRSDELSAAIARIEAGDIDVHLF